MNNSISVNKPMCDWLTITTFEADLAHKIRLKLHSGNAPGQLEKRLQYEGATIDHVFFGSAMQRPSRYADKQQHWMVQASGAAADNIQLDPGWKATRIDLQVTIAQPADYVSRETYDQLVNWWHGGKPRQVSIIQSGDGLDTIYVGDRSSDRFTRIYTKLTDAGVKLLRFEVEYKGMHAQSIFDMMAAGNADIGAILSQELYDLPPMPSRAHMELLKATGTRTQQLPVVDHLAHSKTLEWLRGPVSSTIRRMGNDHDYHDSIVALLKQWYDDIVNPTIS